MNEILKRNETGVDLDAANEETGGDIEFDFDDDILFDFEGDLFDSEDDLFDSEDDVDSKSQNSNQGVKDFEYWLTNSLSWIGQGADIYSRIKTGETGMGVDVTELDEANKENDYSKYYLYGGIGFGVIILLLIVSKSIANKNDN